MAIERSVQFSRRNRRRVGLRLLQHLQCGIQRVAQVGGGVLGAAEATGGNEFYLGRSIRLRHEDAGGKFDLDRTVHGAVGADDVEIDQRGRSPGVLIDKVARLGGRLVGQWTLPGSHKVRTGRYLLTRNRGPSLEPGRSSLSQNRALENARAPASGRGRITAAPE